MAKVVVIGSGAREHALVRGLRRPEAELVAIPGNPGIAREAGCAPAQGSDAAALAAAAVAERPDLVVVGPEAPLAEGFADLMAQWRIACFGPSAGAARIEASKAFGKEVMRAAGVPTPQAAGVAGPPAPRPHARPPGALVVEPHGPPSWQGGIAAADGGPG